MLGRRRQRVADLRSLTAREFGRRSSWLFGDHDRSVGYPGSKVFEIGEDRVEEPSGRGLGDGSLSDAEVYHATDEVACGVLLGGPVHDPVEGADRRREDDGGDIRLGPGGLIEVDTDGPHRIPGGSPLDGGCEHAGAGPGCTVEDHVDAVAVQLEGRRPAALWIIEGESPGSPR